VGGVNVHTWFVGHHPIGHYVEQQTTQPSPPSTTTAPLSKPTASVAEATPPHTAAGPPTTTKKTFFMKSRILAGQLDIHDNAAGVADFQWLAKEEVQRAFHPRYWAAVKNMLVDQ